MPRGCRSSPGSCATTRSASGEIDHALRFTVPDTRAPMSGRRATTPRDSDDPALPPMGQRFRLKADVDISRLLAENQVILQALKTYGMILADNGSPWFFSGAPHDGWDNEDLAELRRVTAADFEAVDSSSLMVGPNSAEASAR